MTETSSTIPTSATPDSPSIQPFTEVPPRAFETERLRLRALQATDAQLIFDLYASDPVATKYMSFKCTGKLSDTEFFVVNAAKFASGNPSAVKHFVWVISLKESGEDIGTAGINPIDNFTLSGGYILNQKFWGKGYASEAWNSVTDWCKTQSGVYRIEAVHAVENPSSGKVMEKAQMKFEGVLRRSLVLPNHSPLPSDVAIYAWVRE